MLAIGDAPGTSDARRAPAVAMGGILTDELETGRRRAFFRATHRGTMEMDWLLGRFATSHLENISREELEFFEHFLAQPDPDLQNMILGREDASQTEFAAIISEIRAFHGLGIPAKAAGSET